MRIDEAPLQSPYRTQKPYQQSDTYPTSQGPAPPVPIGLACRCQSRQSLCSDATELAGRSLKSQRYRFRYVSSLEIDQSKSSATDFCCMLRVFRSLFELLCQKGAINHSPWVAGVHSLRLHFMT